MDRQLNKAELYGNIPARNGYKDTIKHPIVVVLDRIKSGYNIGTIIRTAESLLLEEVLICGDSSKISHKKIRKTAIGADKWLKCECCGSTLDELIKLRAQGYYLVAVEISKNSVTYTGAIYKFPSVFIFGNEYTGISDDVLSMVDVTVHLPTFGMTRSINVSSAASTILYDAISKMGG